MHSIKKTLTRLTAVFLVFNALALPAFALTGTVNCADSPLRLRAQANTDSEILAQLKHGAQVEILSAPESGWYEIAYGSLTGFVSSSYLVVENAQGAVSAASAAAPVTLSTAAPATAAAADSAPVAAAPVATDGPQESVAQYARVNVSSLNVRSGAGTDYDKTGTLRIGRVVEILGESNGWYQIESGYISAEYVTVVDSAEAAASSKGQEIADLAMTFVGYPYVYGGSTPKGFDCSGFVYYIYGQFGYSLSRTASNQMDHGSSVSMSELQPGDLVFFKKSGTGSKRASHVGIYIGGNQFVHASTARVGVIVSNMSDAYYTTGFVGGRRLA